MVRFFLLQLVIVLFAFAVVPAHADEAGDRERAKAEFNSGVKLLDEARYKEAAEALERSLAIRESPAVLYNLGLAYRATDEFRRGVAHLERFLQIAPADKYEDLRAGVLELKQELEVKIVHVTLVLEGRPTRVEVDGEPIPAEPPQRQLRLDPGRHSFEASRSGFAPVSHVVNLKPGERSTIRLDAQSQARPATLEVDAGDIDALIRINGKMMGTSSYRGQLPAGSHTIELSAKGYEPVERKVSLEPGGSERLSISMQRDRKKIYGKWWFWAARPQLWWRYRYHCRAGSTR